MQSSLVGRVVLGIAVVAAAVVLLVLLSSGGSDDGSVPTVPTIVVKDGKPVGGVEELSFEAGDRIRFAVRSDAEDEVHVHGYDVEKEVGPGRTTRFDFPATLEGVFEAELHESDEQIAELRIEP
jgi:hypothetical protein